jgi:hypothetical protein
MVWAEVKKLFPSQWLLVEAVDARTDGPQRIIEQVAVIESFFEDSKQALKKYLELHKVHKDREYYVVHTSKDQLNFEELKWVGVRPG